MTSKPRHFSAVSPHNRLARREAAANHALAQPAKYWEIKTQRERPPYSSFWCVFLFSFCFIDLVFGIRYIAPAILYAKHIARHSICAHRRHHFIRHAWITWMSRDSLRRVPSVSSFVSPQLLIRVTWTSGKPRGKNTFRQVNTTKQKGATIESCLQWIRRDSPTPLT